jgi:hypothetical protein
MDAIVFGFLFVIGAAIAIWFLKAAGIVAQDVTKVALDKASDRLIKTLDVADQLKAAGLRLVPVPGKTLLRHWVNEVGEDYGTNEAAMARLSREAKIPGKLGGS